MRFRVLHTTRYRYSHRVTVCHNEAHLQPRSFDGQRCEHTDIMVEPMPTVVDERTDYFGNHALYFAVQEPHDQLTVTAISTVQRGAPALPGDFQASLAWDAIGRRLAASPNAEALAAREFALDSPLVAASRELAMYALPSFPPGRPVLDAVHDLTQRIHHEFVYDPHFTTISTPPAEVLTLRRGVCQDFAHLAIGCLRSLGLPARYVSGYVVSVPPPGQARLRGADASHAWFAVFDPDAGWVDFDPTNNQIVTTQHITTAWGRDYADVTPLKGVLFGGGLHQPEVAVDVTCIDDA